MRPRYASAIFVRNDAKLSEEELERAKPVAESLIAEIEKSLALPDKAVIDWVLRAETEKGRPRLCADMQWYMPTRPRTDQGRLLSYVFAIDDECKPCTCVPVELPPDRPFWSLVPDIAIALQRVDIPVLIEKVASRLA